MGNEYIVISEFGKEDFAKEVNKWLAAGWVFVGGVSATFAPGLHLSLKKDGHILYSQGMAKKAS